MAIVQASLCEDILTRQERAVIRGIYRASQLAEARKQLEFALMASRSSSTGPKVGLGTLEPNVHEQELLAYFAQAISGALASIKIPASSGKKEISSMPIADQ
jgi:hypothetical protein